MDLTLLLSVIALFILAIVLIWLAARAWRARNAAVRWLGVILAGLPGLIAFAASGLAAIGLLRLYAPPNTTPPAVEVSLDPGLIERGEKFANLCAGCHSSTGSVPLDGGAEFPIGSFASVHAPNLTPAGELADWTDGEIIRAIRDGVDRSGRALLIMPSEDFHTMSDDDVQALTAYIRSQPAVENPVPETRVNLLGAILLGAGIFPTSAQDPTAGPVASPPAGATPEYGDYLTGISGCRGCHGENLMGGTSQFVPIGPPLPPVIAGWSSDDFINTIRTGTDPGGEALDPDAMPWREYSETFTDDELEAIFLYIQDLQ